MPMLIKIAAFWRTILLFERHATMLTTPPTTPPTQQRAPPPNRPYKQPAHIGTYALPTGTYSTGWYEAVKRRFVIPDDDCRVRVCHHASSGKSPCGSFSQQGLSHHLEVGEECVARGRPCKAGTARGINAPASSSTR